MSNSDWKDYYETLEVHRKASPEVIKKAYHALAQKYHPDTNHSNTVEANAKMLEINEAYSVLGNSDNRAFYDKIYDQYQQQQKQNSDTSYAGTQEPFPAPQPSKQQQFAPRPWVRYFAKMTDLFAYGIICLVIMVFISPGTHALASPVISSVILTASALIMESLCLACFGTTLGKRLFNISMYDTRDHSNPFLYNLGKALHRNALIWIRGLGLGIPILWFIPMLLNYRQLMKRGSTYWDTKLGVTVTYGHLGGKRIVAIVAVWVVVTYAYTLPISPSPQYETKKPALQATSSALPKPAPRSTPISSVQASTSTSPEPAIVKHSIQKFGTIELPRDTILSTKEGDNGSISTEILFNKPSVNMSISTSTPPNYSREEKNPSIIFSKIFIDAVGGKIVSTQEVKINGFDSLVYIFNVSNQSTNQTTHRELYDIFNLSRQHTLSFGYPIEEKATWQPVFNQIMKSVVIEKR